MGEGSNSGEPLLLSRPVHKRALTSSQIRRYREKDALHRRPHNTLLDPQTHGSAVHRRFVLSSVNRYDLGSLRRGTCVRRTSKLATGVGFSPQSTPELV